MNPEQPLNNNIPENKPEVEQTPDLPLEEKLTGIQQAIEKKYGIKCPPLTWDIFFGHHQTKEDFEDFIATADNPDVFVMENAGWLEGAEALYQQISNGQAEPERMDDLFDDKSSQNDFSRAFADWIYEKKLPVISMEADDKKKIKEISNIHWKFIKFNKKLDDIKIDTDYHEAVAEYSALLKEWASAEEEREKEILDYIPDKMAELLQTNPELRDKDDLKIKMFYGSFHTALSHELSAAGQNISREFQKDIMPFDLSIQALRYYRFGKTPPPELEEKVLFLDLISHDEVQHKLLPPEEADKPEIQIDTRVWLELRRKILDAISIEDMRQYYEMRRSATPEERFEYVKKILELKDQKRNHRKRNF